MRRIMWPLVILISALSAVLLAGSSTQSPIRILFTFWFLLVCPGMALIRLFHFNERLSEWVLAIALSIALDVVISEIAVLNRWWSLQGIVVTLAILSIAGSLLQLWYTLHPQKRNQESDDYDSNRSFE